MVKGVLNRSKTLKSVNTNPKVLRTEHRPKYINSYTFSHILLDQLLQWSKGLGSFRSATNKGIQLLTSHYSTEANILIILDQKVIDDNRLKNELCTNSIGATIVIVTEKQTQSFKRLSGRAF
ncbi:hypothetical protein MTR_8g039795 [Medicago truncatula]|uniref:Uncharacterized protein n=1 Tax=Medicago truncatula TaxID=3880 RepID=A0A072TZZ4_MEDTR|nr:hypothetical protein MTR_8g039795 [Medicago truncatula]